MSGVFVPQEIPKAQNQIQLWNVSCAVLVFHCSCPNISIRVSTVSSTTTTFAGVWFTIACRETCLASNHRTTRDASLNGCN